MEFFPDQTHVRLRSRVHGTYLHADEGGWGVSLNPHRASLNTAWAVHLLENAGGTTNLLLHSAAYGRHLALWPQPTPQGNHVLCTVQCVYDTQIQGDVMWTVLPAGDGSDDVYLRHAAHVAFPMTRWIVEAIPPRPLPPDLPQQIPNGVGHPVVLRRIIRYVRGNNSEIFNLPWRTFQFNGRSLIDLRGALAFILDANVNDITLCVRAGFHGRRTPLVIDLPISEEPMDIIILTTNSPAALELQHPDVNAP